MTKKKQVGQSNIELRNTLEADVDTFLKKGNKIQQIPSGISGQPTAAKKAPVEKAAAEKAPVAKDPAGKDAAEKPAAKTEG